MGSEDACAGRCRPIHVAALRALRTTPSETAGDKVEALVKAGRSLLPYLRHILCECDYSPTMPSAVDAFVAALDGIGGQRNG